MTTLEILDRAFAFDEVAHACIGVEIPREHEARWMYLTVDHRLYTEQSEADDAAITYYYRPNQEDHILTLLLFLTLHFEGAAIRLPDTERGEEIRDRWLRSYPSAARKLLKEGRA